jgi:outer membrane lipoprotein-sorting protein
VNRFVRTASPRRLLGALLGICAVIALGSTLAVAASSGGPVPAAKDLAPAIHDALAAPPVNGVFADITFKNNLIDSSELQGTDPLLSGGSGRLWLSDDHRFRLELQTTDGGHADAQIVVDRTSWWAYDPGSNTVYRGTLPAGSAHRAANKPNGARDAIPTVAEIQQQLNRVMAHLGVSAPIPSNVAGQPAYTVRATPRDTGGLVGAAEAAWDAARGVPLRVAVYSRSDLSTPVLELAATDIQYGPQDPSVFSVTPPADAKVVRVATATSGPGDHKRRERRGHGQRHEVTGTAAVARRLSFRLDAPASLAGLPRQAVKLLDMSGHAAALVSYGKGLGSVVVVEQAARRKPNAPATTNGGGEDRTGLSLPTVTINGASAQELDTALGTIVRFSRGGISYLVAGSVPKSVAVAAASGL